MRFTKNPELSLLIAVCLALGCQSDGEELEETSADDDSGDDDGDDDDGSVTLTTTMTSAGSEDSGDTGTTGDTAEETTADTTAASDPDTTAGEGPEGSSTVGEEESSTGEQPGNTIYEIQDGTIPIETNVEVYGVVVTGVASNGLFVQEPAGGEYSGTFVFSGMGGPDLSGAQVGDVIDFSGVTDEYFEFTEVDITAGTYVNQGAGTPIEPEVLDIITLTDMVSGEAWEGVLVRIEGDFTVVPGGVAGEFPVSDGADEILIDQFLYSIPDSGDFAGFGLAATFTALQGPLNFSFMEYKIAPRSADDAEGYMAP